MAGALDTTYQFVFGVIRPILPGGALRALEARPDQPVKQSITILVALSILLYIAVPKHNTMA